MDRDMVQVAILMGSKTDLPTMVKAARALEMFGITHEMKVVSAHRAPEEVARFAKEARSRGIRVIIAGAGGAAHLPGVTASYTELPVIGVPVAVGPLGGQDALLSIVQMPRGVPVATVAIGNAWNAGVLAAQILGAGGEKMDDKLLNRIFDYKNEMHDKVVGEKMGGKGR